MMVFDTYVEEGTLELFSFYYAKLIITALSPEWALTAARTINHINFEIIIDKLMLNQEVAEQDYFFGTRVGVDKVLEHSSTPDYRPGIAIMVGSYDKETLELELLKRMYAINCPTVSIYDGYMKREETEGSIQTQNLIQVLSGNKAIRARMGDLVIFSMPTSEGGACRIQPEFHIVKGFMGAHFLICGTSLKDALKATMNAVDAIQDFEDVFCPYPAGIGRLGTVFGSAQFYPTLAEKLEGSRVPKGVKCIYEVEINGIALDDIKKAVRAGIEEACQVKGIKWILLRRSKEEFNGIKIPLTEILI
ncbi:MAG: hypothetical protein ACTSQI_07240 [Candidatus Helarchaeota archaeon]